MRNCSGILTNLSAHITRKYKKLNAARRRGVFLAQFNLFNPVVWMSTITFQNGLKLDYFLFQFCQNLQDHHNRKRFRGQRPLKLILIDPSRVIPAVDPVVRDFKKPVRRQNEPTPWFTAAFPASGSGRSPNRLGWFYYCKVSVLPALHIAFTRGTTQSASRQTPRSGAIKHASPFFSRSFPGWWRRTRLVRPRTKMTSVVKNKQQL